MPIKADSENIDFDKIRASQTEELGLGKHLSRIYDNEAFLKEENSEIKPLPPKEYPAFAKEVYAMARNIEHLNEDDYPTFIEVFSNSRQALKGEPLDYPAYWSNAFEQMSYATSYAVEIEWMGWLEKTKEGRRILARFRELDHILEKTKKYMKVDKLKSAGSDLVEGLKI